MRLLRPIVAVTSADRITCWIQPTIPVCASLPTAGFSGGGIPLLISGGSNPLLSTTDIRDLRACQALPRKPLIPCPLPDFATRYLRERPPSLTRVLVQCLSQ